MDHIGSQRDLGVFPMVLVGSLAEILVVAWKRGWLRLWIRLFLCNFGSPRRWSTRTNAWSTIWESHWVHIGWNLCSLAAKIMQIQLVLGMTGQFKVSSMGHNLMRLSELLILSLPNKKTSSLICQFRYLSVVTGSPELIRCSRRWLRDMLMQQYLPFQGQDGPSSLKQLVLYLLLNSPLLDPSILDNLSASFQSYLHMKDYGKNGLMAVSED